MRPSGPAGPTTLGCRCPAAYPGAVRFPRAVRERRRPLLPALALAVVLGILGMHGLGGGDHHAGMPGMPDVHGMPGMPGLHGMPGMDAVGSDVGSVAGHGPHGSGPSHDGRTAAVAVGGDTLSGAPMLMLCALMLAGGLLLLLARAGGSWRTTARPVLRPGGPIARARLWPPPGAGPPPPTWRFSVVRC